MTPDEMDKILGEHFAAEAAHDVEGILATLTDDVIHDAVGYPGGEVLREHSAIAARYRQLFTAMEDEQVKPVSRLYGEDFLVDECVITTRAGNEQFGVPVGQQVSFRLLHVCEFRDGKISRENVWQGPPTVLAGE